MPGVLAAGHSDHAGVKRAVPKSVLPGLIGQARATASRQARVAATSGPELDPAPMRKGGTSTLSPRRSTERGAVLLADLAPPQPLEVAVGLRRSPAPALEGQKGRLPVHVVLGEDAARTQMPALVDLGAPPSSGHAIATTIAAASCLEGM